MSVAAPLVLREGDQARLESLTRSSSVRAGSVLRARIVLLAAQGLADSGGQRNSSSPISSIGLW